MVRHRQDQDFDAWVAAVQRTGVKELRTFVMGLLKDAAAVRAGLSLIWSNGPTEGFVQSGEITETAGLWAGWRRLLTATHPGHTI